MDQKTINENIKKMRENYDLCGYPFERINIELMPLSGQFTAQFCQSIYNIRMFTLYAPTYEKLMQDINELLSEFKQSN